MGVGHKALSNQMLKTFNRNKLRSPLCDTANSQQRVPAIERVPSMFKRTNSNGETWGPQVRDGICWREAHNIQQTLTGEPGAVNWRSLLSFLSIAELPMADFPASCLSYCRLLYHWSALVTSVGNGSPSNCSQKHCWFLCIIFPPHYMVRDHSIPRQITSEGYFGGRVIGSQIRKPHFQSQLYSEPKQHRTMYITPVYRVAAKKTPKW